MSYEYLYPKVEKLKEKPFIAIDILRMIESWGFRPIAVTVDNNIGRVIIYFDKQLSDEDNKKLNEKMNEFIKNY